MIRYLPLLLLGGFLAELASIIVAGRWLGVIPVLGLILVAGVAGAAVIKTAGISMAEAMRRAPLERGPSAVDAIAQFLALGAGLLLIVPGFLSDIAALILLVPGGRRWLAAKIAQLAVGPLGPHNRPAQGPLIEGTAVEIEVESGRPPNRPAPRSQDID